MTSKLGVELPHRWAGNENWKNIEIDHAELLPYRGGRTLYWQCGFQVVAPREYAHETTRCGGEGRYLITRTSALTGNSYTDYACLYHAKMWINPNA